MYVNYCATDNEMYNHVVEAYLDSAFKRALSYPDRHNENSRIRQGFAVVENLTWVPREKQLTCPVSGG